MKLGIILSIVIVLAIVLGLCVNMFRVADLPTDATSPEKLQKVGLPPSLPVIFINKDNGNSANEAYGAVFQLYMNNRHAYDSDNTPPPLVDQLSTEVTRAMDAGKITKPFLDDQVPMTVMGEPEFGGALEAINDLLTARATKLAQDGDYTSAYRLAMALWALGQRLFENSVRFHLRSNGIKLMANAGGILYQCKDHVNLTGTTDLEKKLMPWNDAIQNVQNAWDDKVKMIMVPSPPSVADLVNIAKKDQDLTFRIEAMLYLSLAKFNPRSEPNKKVIDATIEAGKSDPDPYISAAAKYAFDLTKEQMHRLK